MKDALGHGSNSKGAADVPAHSGAVHALGRLKGWGGAVADQAKKFAKSSDSGGKPMVPSAKFVHNVMETLHEPAVVDYGDTFNNLVGIFHHFIK